MTQHSDSDSDSDSAASTQDPKQQLLLSHHDAEAASPEYGSVCGEEDPGSALESLIDDK